MREQKTGKAGKKAGFRVILHFKFLILNCHWDAEPHT
jgi:hypothetical protein